jgi:hypothetical protein
VSKAQRTEWEIHFHPFQAAIRAGALSATLQNANKMMTMPGACCSPFRAGNNRTKEAVIKSKSSLTTNAARDVRNALYISSAAVIVIVFMQRGAANILQNKAVYSIDGRVGCEKLH